MTAGYRTGEPCPRCRSGSTTSQGECLACGAVWGEDFLCPHCGEHTKPVAEVMVGAACSDCGKPRLGVGLAREAYDGLLARVRVARLWHARAIFYVPLAALVVALVAAGVDFYWKDSARRARHDFIAERGPDAAPATSLAPLAPEPAVAFIVALVGVGIAGVGVYVGVGAALRARVRWEAARVGATGRAAD